MIGTHHRLALEIFDDVKLGKLVKQAGFRSGVALSADWVRIRWQHGARGLVEGMTKNAFAALDYRLGGLAGALAGIVGANCRVNVGNHSRCGYFHAV